MLNRTITSVQLDRDLGPLQEAVRLFRHVRLQGGDGEEEAMLMVANLMVERFEQLVASLLGPDWDDPPPA